MALGSLDLLVIIQLDFEQNQKQTIYALNFKYIKIQIVFKQYCRYFQRYIKLHPLHAK
jgi:hypothetical protein